MTCTKWEYRHGSVIYFIGSGPRGPIKIGYAVNLNSRLEQLQQGNPAALRIEAWTPGTWRGELWLHRQLRPHRIRAEWYRAAPAVLAAASFAAARTHDAPPVTIPEMCAALGYPDDERVEAGSLGERLRLARERAALRHQELSRHCRVAADVISKIERGRNPNPQRGTIERLARSLGVAADWLHHGTGPDGYSHTAAAGT